MYNGRGAGGGGGADLRCTARLLDGEPAGSGLLGPRCMRVDETGLVGLAPEDLREGCLLCDMKGPC
jgi:hypothetical protein